MLPAKVVHFIDSDDPGGAETLVIEICRNLASRMDVEIYHFGNKWIEKACDELNISHKIAPGLFFYKRIATIPLFSLVFSLFLKKNRVDILHSHLFGAITGAAIAARFCSIPHIGTLHDIYTIAENPKKIRLLQLALLLGTRLVVVSEGMKSFYEGTVNFKDGSFTVIRNGTALEKFSPEVPGVTQHADLGLLGNRRVIICVGRLVEIKGHDILIEAFNQLAPATRPALLLVGDGPCREKLSAMITQKGLQNDVHLLGQREDVASLLKLSDFFVLSSHSEGLSCSIIEAMAAGLPVIATDVGSNRELVQDNLTGFVVRPNDPEHLAEKMKALLADRKMIDRFGQASLRRAQQEFSMDRMVKEYTAFYDRLEKTSI